MSRKLASIQRVWSIEPIEGADRIELAHVLGWQCVVNRGQFQPMDLAVYFQIDSFLPVRSEFEFLRKSCYNPSLTETKKKCLGFWPHKASIQGIFQTMQAITSTLIIWTTLCPTLTFSSLLSAA